MSNSNIRWLLAIVLALMVLPAINAGVPGLMNYQGRLTDADGEPLTGNYDMRFRIWSAATGGSIYWSEVHEGVKVVEGLFSVVLGSQGYPLNESVFASTSAWLEIELETGVIGTRTRLTSVGYAHRIATIDGATGGGVTGAVSFVGDVQVAGSLSPEGGIYSHNSITIESAGTNLIIKAGSTQITVSPIGGVTIAAQDITIDASRDITLDAGANLTMRAGDLIALEATDLDVHALSDLTLRADNDVSVNAGGNLDLDASVDVSIDASSNATLEAGSTATVQGTSVWVEGSSAADFRTGGTNTIRGSLVNIN